MRRYLLAFALAALTACDYTPSADEKQNAQQAQLTMQGVNSVGLPSIERFTEKRQLRDIFELRDKAISTYTYIVDMQGRYHKVCDSQGFGIPYATQYTNPERWETTTTGPDHTMPQAEPNGLYAPATADGTWVQCLNPQTKQAVPVYIEPRIIVTPFKLSQE